MAIFSKMCKKVSDDAIAESVRVQALFGDALDWFYEKT